MRNTTILIVLFWASAAKASQEAHPALVVVKRRLEAVLRDQWPAATIRLEGDRLVASHRTRTFTVHPRLVTGDHAVETREIQGPDRRGFRLDVSVVDADFQTRTAFVYPRTMREPYWTTRHVLFALSVRSGFYRVALSYGAGCDRELLDRILACVGRRWMEPPPDVGWRVTAFTESRHVEGRPLRIRLTPQPTFSAPTLHFPKLVGLRIRGQGTEARPFDLVPRLDAFLLYCGREPTREQLMDITSIFWLNADAVSDSKFRFRPKPGKYRLTALYTLEPTHVYPEARMLEPSLTRRIRESNPVEFEVIPEPEAKRER